MTPPQAYESYPCRASAGGGADRRRRALVGVRSACPGPDARAYADTAPRAHRHAYANADSHANCYCRA